MSLISKIHEFRASKKGVLHCTFDPEGPGVVRMHLVPPKFRLFGSAGSILILNGYYLIPLGPSWTVLLSAFIDEGCRYEGKPITDADAEDIRDRAVRKAARVYPFAPREEIFSDLDAMLSDLFAVAHGEEPALEIPRVSIREFSPNMTAPHRMDLMVSAMTDETGAWKCNQKCRFCYAAGQPLGKVRELTTDEWRTALDKLRKAGVPMVTFTGGEPTQRPDLCELVAHASWFVTRLNTNGVNLTKDLCQSLRKASLDSVQITLYSHDENVHNDLVGTAHFADTVTGIRNAVAAGLDVSVNTPLCKKNADYEKTLAFLFDLGVRFITVSGLICTGMAEINHEEYDLSTEELTGIVRAAKEFCDAHGMEMDFTSPGLIPKEALDEIGVHVPMCGAALSNMAISPDGSVIPCQSWLSDGASLGNILTDEFQAIWNAPECVRLRKMSEEEALSCPFRAKKGGR